MENDNTKVTRGKLAIDKYGNGYRINSDGSTEVYTKSTQTLIKRERRVLQDVDTGEIVQAEQVMKRVYGTKLFWKVYLMDFLAVLGILDNKQVDVFVYIVENTNPSNNLFIGTYKKIAEDVKVSDPTISRIMKKLQEKNFIKKVQNGVWAVNPNILMKGDDNKRQILLSYYRCDDPINKLTYSKTKKAEEKKKEEREEKAEKEKEQTIDAEVDPQLAFNENGETIERARVTDK